jgi:hypothetical protein
MNPLKRSLLFTGLLCMQFSFSALCNGAGIGGVPYLYQHPLTEAVGTRSAAMGGTGYALADDEATLFYNPAGLGIKNERWESGALSASYKYSPMVHDTRLGSLNIAFQTPELTSFGFSLYYDNYEEKTQGMHIDDNSEIIDNSTFMHYNESALALGAGYSFHSGKDFLHSLGIGLKWYHESTSNKGEKAFFYANTYAFDFGYLLEIAEQFRIGLSVKNIGPDYDQINGGENVGQASLCFLTAASIGYKKSFTTSDSLRILDLSSEITSQTGYSEFPLGKKRDDFPYHKNHGFLTGIDLCILNTLSGRFGYTNGEPVYKWSGYSLSWGIGLSLLNHFNLDYFRQKRFSSGSSETAVNEGYSISYKRAFKWSRSDKKWWLSTTGKQ